MWHIWNECDQHCTCYWADKIPYMKIQNGHQSATFNRIWPNFELGLYFVLKNTCANYEMNRINSAPVSERTRFHTWKFKMAASRPFLMGFDLISNLTIYIVLMNTCATYEMNRSNIAPVIERTRFRTWKFKMATSRPFLIGFDLISNLTFILS